MLRELMSEWRECLWMAAVDFRKAFDSIDHAYLWKSLAGQRVPNAYIRILIALHTGQSARVRLDKHSRPFCIFRGTKQGDPLSPLLFSAALDEIIQHS
jgi:retron-type reverse transcriptase